MLSAASRMLEAIRKWVGSADTSLARFIRSTARLALRTRARMRSGSVRAEMERIVAEANSAQVGSARPANGPRTPPRGGA